MQGRQVKLPAMKKAKEEGTSQRRFRINGGNNKEERRNEGSRPQTGENKKEIGNRKDNLKEWLLEEEETFQKELRRVNGERAKAERRVDVELETLKYQ